MINTSGAGAQCTETRAPLPPPTAALQTSPWSGARSSEPRRRADLDLGEPGVPAADPRKHWFRAGVSTVSVSMRKSKGWRSDLPGTEGYEKAEREMTILGSDLGLQRRE